MMKQATLQGILAIVLWSSSVALTRSITEALGPLAAGAMIYTLCGLMVLLFSGKPSLHQDKRYLLGCGGLFVIYMVAFTYAIGAAHNRTQVLEISLINYLWPSLTLLLAVLIHKIQVRWWLWLGVLIAFSGVFVVVSGGQTNNLSTIFLNLSDNPLAYCFALLAAIAWALYSNLVRLWCQGKGALALFFGMSAVCLWGLYFYFESPSFTLNKSVMLDILLISLATSVGYRCWDNAMRNGNHTLIAVLSYFTPLLAILIASLWLNTLLPPALSWGMALVILGSLLCWTASRTSAPSG